MSSEDKYETLEKIGTLSFVFRIFYFTLILEESSC